MANVLASFCVHSTIIFLLYFLSPIYLKYIYIYNEKGNMVETVPKLKVLEFSPKNIS